MDPSPTTKTEHNWYPPWAPRFWNGMRAPDYYRLLRENRFQIDLVRYPMAGMVAGCSLLNSTLGLIQNITHGARIRRTELVAPPIFVVGHWRSGTTLMHELLALDSRFAYPCNFDAFIPHHFLLSRFFLYRLVQILMPGKRPMDDMEMGVASPQEDDFALCASGAPTPYRRIAFPNRGGQDHLLLNIHNASPQQLQQIQQQMTSFLQALTLLYRKRLVLKSPPHTGRIEKLAEWFPGARFIHISRHPYDLVPSTMKLWKSLDKLMAFQVPRYDDGAIKNYIFECQDLMYSAYHQQRSRIPSENLIEIRFEDLVANPLQSMERVYAELALEDFAQVRPAIENYFDRKRQHQKNQHRIEDSLRLEIDAHWQNYLKMFGYPASSPEQSA